MNTDKTIILGKTGIQIEISEDFETVEICQWQSQKGEFGEKISLPTNEITDLVVALEKMYQTQLKAIIAEINKQNEILAKQFATN